jgi:DnaJ-class molecular chaperone
MSDGPVSHGPARILAEALRQLHKRAGKPSLEDICLKVRLNEADTQAALDGKIVPDWSVVDTLVRTLKGNIKGFRGLFGIVQEHMRLTGSGDQPNAGPDNSCEVHIHPAWIETGLEVEIAAPGWIACDSCASPGYDNEDAWTPGNVACAACTDTGATRGTRKHLVHLAKETLTAEGCLRVPGMGESSGPGLTPGDLHIQVKLSTTATSPIVRPSGESGCERDLWGIGGPPGQDLAHYEPVSWLRATRGGTLRVGFEEKTRCTTCSGVGILNDLLCPWCDGDGLTMGHRQVNVPIPKRVYTIHWLTVPGQGRPGPRGGQPGDLRIILNAVAPRAEKVRNGAEKARDKAQETWREAAPKIKSTASWLWKNKGQIAAAVYTVAEIAAQAKSRSSTKSSPPNNKSPPHHRNSAESMEVQTTPAPTSLIRG